MVRLKAESSARVAFCPPYGYPRPQTAYRFGQRNSKHIFQLCDVKEPSQIAKQLKREQITTPGYHYYQPNGVVITNMNIDEPYSWAQKRLRRYWRTNLT